MALKYGDVRRKHFGDGYLDDPDLLDLVQKMKVEEAEECNNLYPDARASPVEVVAKLGEKLLKIVKYHRGLLTLLWNFE